MAMTSQSNIRSAVNFDYSKFGYFLNGIDVTSQSLDNFTPYLRGVSRIFIHKLPAFLQHDYSDHSKRFKQYVESAYTAVDGINDVTVDFTEFEGGFAGQRFAVPQLARDDTESITISVYELQGSPVREYLDLWINGVRDKRSGVAHYHNRLKDVAGGYKESNHSAEFVYTNLDPTATECEYVGLFAHAFPTKIPMNHLNYEKGVRSEAQIDMEFRCTKYESPAINLIGMWYLGNSQVKYSYLDFDPRILDDKGNGLYSMTPDVKGKGYRGTNGESGSYAYGSFDGAGLSTADYQVPDRT